MGGNSSDEIYSIHVDAVGNQFISGMTQSFNNTFPLLNASQSTFTTQTSFITKFDGGGSTYLKHQLRWSTFFGNIGVGYDIKTNSIGDVYMCGESQLITPKTEIGAYNDNTPNSAPPYRDAFIAKFKSSNGTVKWATYFGGANNDMFFSMDFDSYDNLYVAGQGGGGSYNLNLSGAYNQVYSGSGDGLLAKFNSSDDLVWCTFYGGSSTDFIATVKVDGNNNVAIAGYSSSSNLPFLDANQNSTLDYFQPSFGGVSDVFIAKFNSSGVRQWGTYFGGTKADFPTNYWPKNMIAFDPSNNLYIVGTTKSNNTTDNFPIQSFGYTGYSFNDNTYANEDGYIARFSPSYHLDWSTYVSANGLTNLNAIVIDEAGKIFIGGGTSDDGLSFLQSSNLYFQSSIKADGAVLGRREDAFIMALDQNHFLTWMTPIGGHNNSPTFNFGEEIMDLDVFGNSELYASGLTNSNGGVPYVLSDEFPTFDYDVSSSSDFYVFQNQGFVDGFILSFCTGSLIYTSVEEPINSKSDFLVYPNPSTNLLNIQVLDNKAQKISIYDVTGKLIKTVNNKGNQFITIDISSLSTGTFIISLQSKTGITYEKFIKQ